MIGIKRDRYGFRAYVKVGSIQREKRFPPDTKAETMKAWRDECRVALRKIPQRTTGTKGSFAADVKAYLEAVKPTLDPATYRSRICELDAYLADCRHEPRAALTRERLLTLRTMWLTEGQA